MLTEKEKREAKQLDRESYNVSLYDQPPNEDIKLEEFEKYALDRVRLLTAIENALSSGKKQEELQELIKEKTKSLKLEPKSIADEVSHYALRLAFCRTESLRRQFLTSEVQLFKARFREMKGADKAKFIEHELDYNSMDFNPKYVRER